MKVLISGPPKAIRGSRVDVVGLQDRGEVLLRALGEDKSELSIALVDDPEIKALNTQWRNLPHATDVLSFSQGPTLGPPLDLLGDVVISVETAAKQAADRHRGLDDTVTRLLIHGLLHLLGHDHEVDADASRMAAEERRLWQVVKR
jgi:rRNA maturation RNase YbeY